MVEALSFIAGDRPVDNNQNVQPDAFSGFCFVATQPTGTTLTTTTSTSASTSAAATSRHTSPRAEVKVSGKDIISVCYHIDIQSIDGLPESLNGSSGVH
jgi:transglutaminase/protease-like cytokinesis protein 3